MRSTRSFLMVLAAVAFATASCSSSSNDGEGDSGETTTTDAATYIDGVCTSLSDWKTGLDDDNLALQTALDGTPTPEESKTALVDFLTTTVDGTKAMVSDIEALGVPDVDGGDEIASTLSTELGKVTTLFEGVLDDVENLSTDDPQAMVTALGELGTTISDGSAGIGTALGDLDAPELEEAAQDSEACQALVA
jgi:hypothetical protein